VYREEALAGFLSIKLVPGEVIGAPREFSGDDPRTRFTGEVEPR
jgi:hypothetical protein